MYQIYLISEILLLLFGSLFIMDDFYFLISVQSQSFVNISLVVLCVRPESAANKIRLVKPHVSSSQV